jgi:hypothetical protein
VLKRWRPWLLGCGLAGGYLAASCGGSRFGTDFTSGGSAPAEMGEAGAGVGASVTGGAGAADNAGGVAGSAPEPPGVAGEAGAGGLSPTGSCADWGGQELAGHCYVDATVESETQPQALVTCSKLALSAGRTGHLLVLDSAAEQTFILQHLLLNFTDVSDAWLALTCNVLDWPDVNDCYCKDCSATLLHEKQQAWRWINDSPASFGWINGNPNAASRCAALGYNPDTTNWGWVDRPCDKASLVPAGKAEHTYRTICELEP